MQTRNIKVGDLFVNSVSNMQQYILILCVDVEDAAIVYLRDDEEPIYWCISDKKWFETQFWENLEYKLL